MTVENLTKEDRLKLHAIQEDYLEIFHTMPEMRDDKPEMWHRIVDQFEIIKQKLEDDEWEKIKSTCHTTIDDAA